MSSPSVLDSPAAALDELLAWAAAAGVSPDPDRKLTPADAAALTAVPPLGAFAVSVAAVAPAAFFDYPTFRKLADGLAGRLAPAVHSPAAEPIAVVGVAGRFPGADDVAAFWDLLANGRDAVGPVPANRWSGVEFDALGVPPGEREAYLTGGFLADAEGFDAGFFDIAPGEALVLDPQARVLLEETYRALDDAGCNDSGAGSRTGLFVGASGGEYSLKLQLHRRPANRRSLSAHLTFSLAARVAHELGLGGPAVMADVSCASSVAALHLACESLRAGECEVAVAAGVAVQSTPQVQVWAGKAGVTAKAARCRPFSHDADGFVTAEGCGVLVLKKLTRAVADGDTVYAVVRGCGVGQTGGLGAFFAPSAVRQADVYAGVLARAGVLAADIGCVEAQGSGAARGDAAEVRALTAVFGPYVPTGSVPLGSVKSNIGHALAAAGMAGLVKTILQLRHRQLAPSLHFAGPNPAAGLDGSPFAVTTTIRDWPAPSAGPRRAMVHAFAINGANGCAVLEDSPDPVASPGLVPAGGVVCGVSAASPEALRAWAGRLAEWVSRTDPNPVDAARTVAVGRRHLRYRAAVVAGTAGELAAGLAAVAAGQTGPRVRVGNGVAPADRHLMREFAAGAFAGAAADPDPLTGRRGLRAVAQLYVDGWDIDFASQAGGTGRRLPFAPVYPFVRSRFWPDAADSPAPREPVAVPVAEAAPAGADDVRAIAAAVLRVPPSALDPSRPLVDQGLESVAAMELRDRLAERFGADLPLAGLLEAGSVAGIAARAAVAPRGPKPAAPVFVPAPDDGSPFPLTDIQTAYLLGRSPDLDLGGTGCHAYWEFEAAAEWDVPRLAAAWRELVRAHDMLRAVVRPDGTQHVLPSVPDYEPEVHDWRDCSPADAASCLAAVREAMAHEVFAPDRWPLFRIGVSLDPGRSRLHFSVDLLIADALSLFRLLAEWGRLVCDPAATVAAPAVRFRDYVASLEAARTGPAYTAAVAYWDRVADALPPAPDLPTRPGPAGGPARFVRRQAVLGAAEWANLRDRSRRAGVTPTAAILQAFADVLGRWGGAPRFTVNMTTFQRPPIHPAIREVVGDFTSTVLVDFDTTDPAPFRAAAKATLARVAERLDHAAVSGVEVLRRRAKRTGDPAAARMPVVFTSMLGLEEPGADGRLTPLGDWTFGVTQTPQVLIDCQVMPDGDRVVLSWDTVDARFPEGLPADLFAAFADRVRRLAARADDWNAPPPVGLPEAQRAVRSAVNATAAPVPDGLLHDGFVLHAEATPDRVAVIAPGKSLTYGELLDRARGVAAQVGPVSPGEPVALLVGKGWEQPAAVFGVLLAGGAYLPLDPATPPARRNALLARTGVRVALVAGDESHDLPAGVRAVRIRDVDGSRPAFAPVRVPSSALAYVIFTSGSTGEPKGVMVEHRAALNTVHDVNRRFGVGPGDRVLGLSALGFDLSVYDLFGPLAAGGAVVLPDPARARDPDYLGPLVRDTGVTVWNSVPMYLQLLLDGLDDRAGGFLRRLRLALLSGDWVPVALAGRVRAAAPGCAVVSLGGATEAAVWSIFHPVADPPPPDWPSVPYGKPLANQWFRVLDAAGRDAPDWVPGELAIGGVGLARGYWGDPTRTAERFVTDPRTGERLYRTGDRGRYRPCGNIEFLGRDDGQVKVGGHRIELGEIEAVAGRCPGVTGAVASTEPGPDGRPRLAAVYAGDAEPDAVREFFRTQLPGYMLPARLDRVDRLPLTANGKVDRGSVTGRSVRVSEARPGATPGLGNPPAAAGTITDPADRAAFARRRSAARTDLPAGVPLPPASLPPGVADRRSHRRFAAEPVALADLARVLAVLAEGPDGRPGYPSAGSTYPVQAYLHARPGGVTGLAPGVYYVPLQGRDLQPVSPGASWPSDLHHAANRDVAAAARFAVYLVADLAAIEPLYGSLSGDLCLVEAGYIGHALMHAATGAGLGLCPVGALDFAPLRSILGVGPRHEFVHALLGGKPAPVPEVACEPATRREEVTAAIARFWGDALRTAAVPTDRNIFEAGGDSFTVIAVTRRIREELGLPCTATDLFAYPTIARLAAHLTAGPPAGADPPPPTVPTPAATRRDRRAAFRRADRPHR